MGADEGGRLEQAREESIRRLKTGALPILAEQRLQELRGRRGFFTSDLSVSEFAVSKDTGLRPVSHVMGSSVYHAYYGRSKSWNAARATALRRLALEAKACGAEAVVGVHITYGDREFASSSVEFVALGTAVSGGRKVSREPVLTALSAQDYWRLVRRGYEALGVVASTSIAACLPSVATQQGQRFGVLAASGRQNREVEEFSRSVRLAYAQARSEMQAQAQAFRAEGIVGVRLDVGGHEWGADLAEFIAIGTAIRHSEGQIHRAPNGRPFTSDLSGQDFWTLLRSGHRPVGMVMGSCVYHVGRRGFIQATAQTGRNVEMANYTQALYDARELAMGRMQDEAEQSQAQGIVGVQIQEKNHGWGSHTIEFFATAQPSSP